ncbi:MAG TPA: class I SAM-dependent methyltransferase [Candidatus Paceibacterota bacterium]|jgi:SAM-dependent methyltransferase|nr:class I SAM-dependent methyltransferase [Candidatus Paceibacterota bacterium]HRT56961.1 class I SAM-dependent methyltransferase [Candidatus Paceibacterota bacterium]
MAETIQYAEPLRVEDPSECAFYHRMELPGLGVVGGQWDLRDVINDYLGRFDFKGKRVLDVGTASGYLTFEMEKRGAEVVSFDMAEGEQWDLVPQRVVRREPARVAERLTAGHRRLRKGYWLAHERLGSRARVFYGNIYHLPEALGPFDVAMMGMIIGHLRDPFHALHNVARLCRSHLILTNQSYHAERAEALLMPSVENQETMAWWALSDGCLKQMLRILGFEVQYTCACEPRCLVPNREGREPCISLVARRIEE